MSEAVILDFQNVATWSDGAYGKGGVQLNPDIVEWLETNNHNISSACDWLLGSMKDKWRVRFWLKDKDTAVLFKLTFGGR